MNAPHQAQPPLQHVVLLKFCQALTAAEDAEMRTPAVPRVARCPRV